MGHIHNFREHDEGADAWAEEGAKGRVEVWVDTAHVVWSEVFVCFRMVVVTAVNVESVW